MMVTKIIDLQHDKTELAELLTLIATGAEIILTEGNTPVARLVPYSEPSPSRIPGLHSGSAWTSQDFNAPLSDDFWVE
jgi:antitoxin (DNA-binding transcriptional repressor) of toxin-antitoxin stability system